MLPDALLGHWVPQQHPAHGKSHMLPQGGKVMYKQTSKKANDTLCLCCVSHAGPESYHVSVGSSLAELASGDITDV